MTTRNIFEVMKNWDPYMKIFVMCNYTLLFDPPDDIAVYDRVKYVTFNSRFHEANMKYTSPSPPEEVQNKRNFNLDDWIDPTANLRWIKTTQETERFLGQIKTMHH
jgi:hypothetical protein